MDKMIESSNTFNDKERLVDVVIPCYNASKTLPRLLCSIGSQVVSDKINVILVDDFSDEEESKEYYELIKPFHKIFGITIARTNKNVGPGAARRIGMQLGKSKYIMFADADDELFNSYSVKLLLDRMEQANCEIVYSDFLEEMEDGRFVPHNNDGIWMFGKMFRRSFIESKGLYFNDTRANEDFGFNTLVRFFAQPQYVNATTYIWSFNPNSITRRNDGAYEFTCYEGQIENKIWAINTAIDKGASKKDIPAIVLNQMLHYYLIYIKYYNSDKPYVNMDDLKKWSKKFYDEYKQIIDDALKDKNILKDAYIRQLAVIAKNTNDLYIPHITFYKYIEMLRFELIENE